MVQSIISEVVAGGAEVVFGSEGKSTSSGTADRTGLQSTTAVADLSSSTTSDIMSQLQQLVSGIQQQQSTGTGTSEEDRNVNRLTAGQTANLEQLIAGITGRIEGNLDFDAIRQAAVTQSLEAGASSIIEAGTNSGAYDSTVQGTAAEKVSARAALEGTQAETSARLTEQGQLTSAISQLTNILTQAQEQSTAAQRTTDTQDSSSTSSERTGSTQSQQSTEDKTSQQTQTQDTTSESHQETTSKEHHDEDGLIDMLGGGLDDLGDMLGL